ncbi:MAG: S1C family serine protease [Pirellulales bacterium]
MTPRPFSSILLAAAIAAPAMAAEVVTVTLVGGSRVTGPLLRRNDDGVVIDLGFEPLQIPAKKVLDVRAESPEETTAAESDRDIFRTGMLEAREVPELVKRFGEAVVMVRNPGGLGTGFLISRDGHLVTNYHVVENNTRLQVTLFRRTDKGFEKNEYRKVKIVALQPLRDLAILQLDPEETKGRLPEPVVINDRDDLRVGDLVFAIGNPAGLERSVTQGIVSSTTRTIDQMRLIQTDAAINPGNSGGPIFNARGEVVAVACAGAAVFEGLAFGIPANELLDFLVHRDTYPYDESQPQNGVTYLPPPFQPALPLEGVKASTTTP